MNKNITFATDNLFLRHIKGAFGLFRGLAAHPDVSIRDGRKWFVQN